MVETEELSEQCGGSWWKWRSMEKEQEKKVKERVSLVMDLAKAFERVSFLVVWAWATHFSFPEDFAGALRFFRAPEEGAVRRMCGRTVANHRGILPGSEWSCLILRILLQDALSEVLKIYPPLKLRVFVDDNTAPVKGRNKEVAEIVSHGKW